MEIVERCSDVKDLETDLNHDEEEQRDQDDCNKREDNFFNVGHGDLSFYDRLKPKGIGKTIVFFNKA